MVLNENERNEHDSWELSWTVGYHEHSLTRVILLLNALETCTPSVRTRTREEHFSRFHKIKFLSKWSQMQCKAKKSNPEGSYCKPIFKRSSKSRAWSRSYVDSKRNKRFELLGSIVKILNSVPFSVVYLEHQLCACQRHFEMLYWGSRFLDLPRNVFQMMMMMMIIQWFLQRKVQIIPPSLPSLLFLRSFKEISCDQSAHSLKLFVLIIVFLFFL